MVAILYDGSTMMLPKTRSYRIFLLILLWIGAFAPSMGLTAQSTHRVKIVLVGDSTVHADGGWGGVFCQHMKPEMVECINAALNGRSSKSFYDEGAWAKVLALHPKYILMQFGHNDTKGKGPERESDPEVAYPANMRRYITEAKAAGAVPIVVTSLVRRNYTNGVLRTDSLNDYANAAKKVAAEEHVPVIDLYGLSVAVMQEKTQEQADAWNAHLHPDADAKKPDRTHLNATGQAFFGEKMAREFAKVEPQLADAVQ